MLTFVLVALCCLLLKNLGMFGLVVYYQVISQLMVGECCATLLQLLISQDVFSVFLKIVTFSHVSCFVDIFSVIFAITK